MRHLLLLFLSLLFVSMSYSQEHTSILTVFCVNQFNNDSVHITLNENNIYRVRLNTEPSTGQCEFFFTVQMADSAQKLTFFEISSRKKNETIIKKEFKYLYVYKISKDNYRFDYSNKLSLPE